MNVSRYTSCIKIKGKPILPPLITPEEREEMKNYKLKAIEVENHTNLLRQSKHTKENDINRQKFNTLEHQLAFDNGECRDCCSSGINHVPSKPHFNLSCNIVDVTEYKDNNVRLFSNTSVPLRRCLELEYSNSPTNNVKIPQTVCSEPTTPPNEPSIPLLTRSNSYTLESPSPALLALYPNFSTESGPDDELKTAESSLSINIDSCKEFNYSADKSVPKCDNSSKEIEDFLGSDNMTNQNGRTDEQENTVEDKIKSPISIQSQHTRIFDSVDSDIFKSFIERLNAEEPKILPLVNESKENQLTQVPNETEDAFTCDLHNLSTPGSLIKPSDTLSFTSSQTLYYTFSSEASTPVGKLIDIDDNCDIVTLHEMRQLTISPKLKCSEKNQLNKNLTSRVCNPRTEQYQIEEKAACVIGAFAKGYLTRRLLKTDKVKDLIQTIKDALICAVELHKEAPEKINEADVELHRRLIQQVSAACYAFHDVFFSLTKKEQMALISQDRQKQKEKLKRKSSAASSVGSGRRSVRKSLKK